MLRGNIDETDIRDGFRQAKSANIEDPCRSWMYFFWQASRQKEIKIENEKYLECWKTTQKSDGRKDQIEVYSAV